MGQSRRGGGVRQYSIYQGSTRAPRDGLRPRQEREGPARIGGEGHGALAPGHAIDLAKIPVGRKPPHDVNVVVEIPQGGVPIKYEIDKASGRYSSTAFSIRRCSIPAITALCLTHWPKMATRSMC